MSDTEDNISDGEKYLPDVNAPGKSRAKNFRMDTRATKRRKFNLLDFIPCDPELAEDPKGKRVIEPEDLERIYKYGAVSDYEVLLKEKFAYPYTLMCKAVYHGSVEAVKYLLEEKAMWPILDPVMVDEQKHWMLMADTPFYDYDDSSQACTNVIVKAIKYRYPHKFDRPAVFKVLLDAWYPLISENQRKFIMRTVLSICHAPEEYLPMLLEKGEPLVDHAMFTTGGVQTVESLKFVVENNYFDLETVWDDAFIPDEALQDHNEWDYQKALPSEGHSFFSHALSVTAQFLKEERSRVKSIKKPWEKKMRLAYERILRESFTDCIRYLISIDAPMTRPTGYTENERKRYTQFIIEEKIVGRSVMAALRSFVLDKKILKRDSQTNNVLGIVGEFAFIKLV